MSKSKLSIITTSLKQQLAIGFATMMVLPLLALCYFILCYIYPNIQTKESILLVIVLAIVISLLGFSLMSRIVRLILQLAQYLETIAAGDLTQKIEIHNGGELSSITRSLNLILERLQEEQQERVEAETARATIEIIQCLPDSLVVLNLDGEVTSVNPAYLKMFGHKTENEVLGISIDGFQEAYCNPEKDIPRSLELFKEVIEKGFTDEPVEMRLRRTDGKEFIASITGSLISDANGNPKYAVTLMRDVTELKRAEEERARLAAERVKVEEDKKRMAELEKFTKVAVGRELKMKRMEKELEALRTQNAGAGKSDQ